MNEIKPSHVVVYHVFLASPSDVMEERQEVRRFFDEYNRTTANPRGVRFEVVDWENYASVGVGRTQALIDEQTIERFKDSLALVVVLMGARFGRPTGDFQSGTQEEFAYALKLNQERNFPEIKWFLRRVKKLDMLVSDPQQMREELDQWEKVRAFQDRLNYGNPPIFYKKFDDLEDFRQIFGQDLRLWLGHPERHWFNGRSLPDAHVETMIADVLTNIEHLDSRLLYVTNAVDTEASDEERLKHMRASIMPNLAAANAASFDRLTAEARVASLRAALSSAPLYTNYSQELVKGLVDKGVKADVVTAFYARLGEAADGAESLLRHMSDSAAHFDRTGPLAEETRTVDRQIIVIAARSLGVRSLLAHLAGLRLLNWLKKPLPPEVNVRLTMLRNLEPRAPVSEERAIEIMSMLVDEWEVLVQEKAHLVKRQKELYEKSLQEFEALKDKTDILPTDPWYVVVGKARSLRQFGRIPEAVGAYARYADLFSSTDPTAKQYSQTACQFTLQIEELGVTGGLYAYKINPGSAAEQAGIREGDILISYAGSATPEQKDLMEAFKAAPKGDPVRAEFLRLGASDQFERLTITLPAGSLGAGTMPI